MTNTNKLKVVSYLDVSNKSFNNDTYVKELMQRYFNGDKLSESEKEFINSFIKNLMIFNI
jgi:hypothetical protein